jgi:hypothetical protein
MDTLMAIRSGIFLVAGVAAIAFPKRVFAIQTRVITYLAETFHFKFLNSLLKVEQERGTSGLIRVGVVFLIISAILFVWALD